MRSASLSRAAGPASSASLPPTITNLIDRVIRRTRLWPAERRDVRAELESHFREGLLELEDEGLSPDSAIELLINHFGNPELAAALIRRGKKRGRPMLWKIAVSTTLAAIGVAIAGGGYVAYQTFASPHPTVDYVKALNEPTEQTAVEERAWPVLREALLAFKPMPESLSALNPAVLRPGTTDWATVTPWLEENRPLLKTLQDAAEKPYYGFVYGGPDTTDYLRQLAEINNETEKLTELANDPDPLAPPMIGILLPHLADARKVAWFLVLNARDDHSAGRHREAWQSVDICNRLGFKLFEGQTLIEQLVGAVVIRLADEEARRMIFACDGLLTPEEVSMLRNSSLLTQSLDSLTPHLEGERLTFADAVQYVFTDDGQGNGRMIPSQYQRLVEMGNGAPSDESWVSGLGNDALYLKIAASHADRSETMSKYEVLWKQMAQYRSLSLTDPGRSLATVLIKNLNEGGDATRFAMVATMLPNLNYADQIIREVVMDVKATRAVFAMSAYRRDRGVWPENLESLVPHELSEVPIDIYADRPLRYRLNANGKPVLYSIWRDRKDDNGSMATIPDSSRDLASATTSADQVYFPARNP